MVAAKEEGHIKTQETQECFECHKSRIEAYERLPFGTEDERGETTPDI